MFTISQNNALSSLNRALVPGSQLIDGRDEKDVLAFLSNYASLINFYDQYNHLNGSWTPFLLKDPLFLTARISKIPFPKIHGLYLNTCSNLERSLLISEKNAGLSVGFNQLFDQVFRIFFQVSEWLSFMQGTNMDYPLKQYVIQQVHENFSPYFWALRNLRETMAVQHTVYGIEPPAFVLPTSFDTTTWTDNKEIQPYWEVLGLQFSFENNSTNDLYTAITAAANKLFVFFQIVIKGAAEAYESLSLRKSPFPDTTLLRTFTRLLDVSRQEMNGLSEKHLDFYYRNILKQHELPAVADSAYVSATLSKPQASYVLPKGTQLNAGLDANKNPIVFETTADAELNPAAFTGAYTLSAVQGTDQRYALYLNQVAAPSALNKDANGQLEKWPTFGGSKYSPAIQANMGFSLASPMFMLLEGTRNISITIDFEEKPDLPLLQKAKYFLSTQKSWLEVTPQTVVSSSADTSALISISLDNTQPAIEAFVKNPDGYANDWPLLKVVYGTFGNLTDPPLMKKMQIGVTASDLQTFQLYNDYGALSIKTPYPLFGPTPMPSNDFIIGSAEIFSKPFTSLNIQLNWSGLPPDFADYYAAYNSYLTWCAGGSVMEPITLCGKIKKALGSIFGKKKTSGISTNTPEQFSNASWQAGFGLMSGSQWGPLGMQPVYPGTPPTPIVNYLFTTDGSTLQSPINFTYVPGTATGFVPNAEIQNSALKFTDSSTDGFMKIYLDGIDFGFGSGMYAGVVSYIALQNANIVANKLVGAKFLTPANLPYVPKLAQFTASYSATYEYDFNYSKSTYPVQCYFYTPFATYLVYDSTQDASAYSAHIGTSITSPQTVRDGLPLFAPMQCEGVLFLQTQNLVAADTINFYFELARNYVSDTTVLDAPGYFCLSTGGWQPMQVYADCTNNLSCPGIVKLGLPANPDNNAFMMPTGSYWFSVAVAKNAAAYAETFFLTPNGFAATRSGTTFLTDTQVPMIAAESITKPLSPVPQIATLSQPFPSFGGQAAETATHMQQRVSNRIKTKDRALSREDYFRLIIQQFPEIYYVKSLRSTQAAEVEVLLVKKYDNASDPNAFTPMVSLCTESKVTEYLAQRTSGFVKPNVSNFNFQYVQATVTISVLPGYEFQGVKNSLNTALKIFMSPWITSGQQQVPIDNGITYVQVATFAATVEGVDQVVNVSLSSYTAIAGTPDRTAIAGNGSEILPQNEYSLLVPSSNQLIIQASNT